MIGLASLWGSESASATEMPPRTPAQVRIGIAPGVTLISFRSTGVEAGRGGLWKVTGDLTVKDVTRPVALEVEFDGAQTSPWGDLRVGFSAATELDREAWGLTWNQALETGGVVVGKKVRIELNVEAVRK